MTLPSSYRERELLLKVSRSDEKAFRHLFQVWHQVFAGYIFRLTNSRQHTEEILQDVFLKVWLNRKTLAGVENFKNYLFIISRNKAFSFMKKELKETRKFADWAASRADIPAEETERPDAYFSLLDEAIDLLPPRRKEVYLLSRHNRLTYKEIAKRLQISTESVKTHLRLANEGIASHLRSGIIQVVMITFLLSRVFYFSLFPWVFS